MTERSPDLSKIEKKALKIHEAIPRARTIEAWLAYAATRALAPEAIGAGTEHIRGISSRKRLKKLREKLAAATEVSDLMPAEALVEAHLELVGLRTDEDQPQVAEKDEKLPDESIAQHDSQEDEAGERQEIASVPPVAIDDGEATRLEAVTGNQAATHNGGTESQEAAHSGLSPKGFEYAKATLGDDVEFTDLTVHEVAQRIYERAGSPKTYTRRGGPKIDPIKMLEHKLMGKDHGVIAELEGVSTSYTNQWFKKINTKIHDRTPPLESEDLSSETPSETLQPEPSGKSLSSTPATHQPDSHEEQEQSTGIDFAERAKGLPEEMKVEDAIDVLLQAGFSQDEVEALKVFTTFDEESRYRTRTDATKSALNRLQALLVSYKGMFEDERSLSSLRMLTNTAHGPKSLDDVYYRLHGKDQKTQRSDVETIVRSGMLELVQNGR